MIASRRSISAQKTSASPPERLACLHIELSQDVPWDDLKVYLHIDDSHLVAARMWGPVLEVKSAAQIREDASPLYRAYLLLPYSMAHYRHEFSAHYTKEGPILSICMLENVQVFFPANGSTPEPKL